MRGRWRRDAGIARLQPQTAVRERAARPASPALMRACSITRVEMSEPTISIAAPSSTVSRAPLLQAPPRVRARSHRGARTRNDRSRPGARPDAMRGRLDDDRAAAAERVEAAARSGVQPESASRPAARFSFSGASPLSARQPRLKSGSPRQVDVERHRAAIEIGEHAHVGVLPVDRGSFAGQRRAMRSTMPSLIRNIANSRLASGERERGDVDPQRLLRRHQVLPADFLRGVVQVLFGACSRGAPTCQRMRLAMRECRFAA